MAELRDRHNFYHYVFSVEDFLLWPPLYPKSSCLISAVVHNNVEKLKMLLDSPRWYGVTDEFSESLLHIAVELERVEVFDYLLSLHDFPLDAVNDKQDTALISYLKFYHKKPEYFPKTLIRRGADLNVQGRDGETALHICCKRHDNSDNSGLVIEIIAMLLYYGADPSITDHVHGYNVFEVCVIWTLGYGIWSDGIYTLIEQLFNLTLDEFNSNKIDFKVLILLATKNCSLFHKVYDCVEDVSIDDCDLTEYLCRGLFQMNLKYLKLLKEKYEDAISEILSTCHCFTECDIELVSLENVEFLLESTLRSQIIEVIVGEHIDSALVGGLVTNGKEKMLTEKVCFFLSYGMKISTRDLDIVHEGFPNCELFKMLLHMDLEITDDNPGFTRLYYDIRTDVESIRPPFKLTSYQTDLLLGLCAHPKMKDHCSRYGVDKVAVKVTNLPEVPSLVEHARNVFRSYFIETLKIDSARQFYTMVKLLPISTVYKDIITYQKKIY